jgi:hypothetical protein
MRAFQEAERFFHKIRGQGDASYCSSVVLELAKLVHASNPKPVQEPVTYGDPSNE